MIYVSPGWDRRSNLGVAACRGKQGERGTRSRPAGAKVGCRRWQMPAPLGWCHPARNQLGNRPEQELACLHAHKPRQAQVGLQVLLPTPPGASPGDPTHRKVLAGVDAGRGAGVRLLVVGVNIDEATTQRTAVPRRACTLHRISEGQAEAMRGEKEAGPAAAATRRRHPLPPTLGRAPPSGPCCSPKLASATSKPLGYRDLASGGSTTLRPPSSITKRARARQAASSSARSRAGPRMLAGRGRSVSAAGSTGAVEDELQRGQY